MRYCSTGEFALTLPGFRRSPRMRGAPHRGLAVAMPRSSLGIAGRPGRLDGLRRAQSPRTRGRCQSSPGAGCTKPRPARQRAPSLDSHDRSIRSLGCTCRRRLERRDIGPGCCTARISSCSDPRDRNKLTTPARSARTTGCMSPDSLGETQRDSRRWAGGCRTGKRSTRSIAPSSRAPQPAPTAPRKPAWPFPSLGRGPRNAPSMVIPGTSRRSLWRPSSR